MPAPPTYVKHTLFVFYAATVITASLTLVFVWSEDFDQALFRVFLTSAVVLGAAGLVLAAYRTVHLVTRRDG